MVESSQTDVRLLNLKQNTNTEMREDRHTSIIIEKRGRWRLDRNARTISDRGHRDLFFLFIAASAYF